MLLVSSYCLLSIGIFTWVHLGFGVCIYFELYDTSHVCTSDSWTEKRFYANQPLQGAVVIALIVNILKIFLVKRYGT